MSFSCLVQVSSGALQDWLSQSSYQGKTCPEIQFGEATVAIGSPLRKLRACSTLCCRIDRHHFERNDAGQCDNTNKAVATHALLNFLKGLPITTGAPSPSHSAAAPDANFIIHLQREHP